MGIISVVLFFLYFWGFGFGLLKALKAKEAAWFLERQIMRTGIGAGALIITAMILNIAKVPLDWKVFLVLALLAPFTFLAKNFRNASNGIKQFKLSLKKSDIAALAILLMFAGSLYMYDNFDYHHLLSKLSKRTLNKSKIYNVIQSSLYLKKGFQLPQHLLK